MRTFSSYLRVITIVALVFMAAEYFIDSGDKPAFMEYPEVLIFMALFTITLIAIEIMVGAMKGLADRMMTEDQKKAYALKKAEREENAWYRKWYKSLTKSKAIEEEGEIILDHNYDGIKELDNALPPWWLYGFYFTILFAVIYLVRFEIMGADNQVAEYEKAVAEAQLEIEAYKRTAKDLVDINTVTVLTEASDISAGKAIFTTSCVVCHMADGGGGIGPNLTDKYWILGGGIKDVFKTVSEGGRDGKGMVAWKSTLKPLEIQQVSSYLLTFQGTTAANPKDPEGEIWIDENAPAVEEQIIDSVQVVTDTVTTVSAVNK